MKTMNNERALDSNLSNALKKNTIKFKQDFINIMEGKMRESLISLIGIENVKDTDIDVMYLQYMLRNNYTVVLGENAINDKIIVLGYLRELKTNERFLSPFSYRFTKKDIVFTCPKNCIKDEYIPINYYDPDNGNCVLIKNKYKEHVTDYQVINHYISSLAEIVISRYSLSIQARFMTMISTDDPDSQTINNLIESIYNADPFPKVDKDLTMMGDLIKIFENTAFSSNSSELKREYQNKLSELNNLIGIQSLSVEKESGVSDDEARGNKSSTIAFGNIYLKTQQMSLDLLNKRYGLDLKSYYYNDVESKENIKIHEDVETEEVKDE